MNYRFQLLIDCSETFACRAAAASRQFSGGVARWQPMDGRDYAGVSAAGILGAAGPVCFLLASRHALLVATAVLAALYPGVTVGLARIVLHEASRRAQLIGLIPAAIAVVAITIGSRHGGSWQTPVTGYQDPMILACVLGVGFIQMLLRPPSITSDCPVM